MKTFHFRGIWIDERLMSSSCRHCHSHHPNHSPDHQKAEVYCGCVLQVNAWNLSRWWVAVFREFCRECFKTSHPGTDEQTRPEVENRKHGKQYNDHHDGDSTNDFPLWWADLDWKQSSKAKSHQSHIRKKQLMCGCELWCEQSWIANTTTASLTCHLCQNSHQN